MRPPVLLLAYAFCLTRMASAVSISFLNRCSHPIELVHAQGFTAAQIVATIASGGSHQEQVTGPAHMFRHGMGDQATLAEFSMPDDVPWYDISIIPPGPRDCNSYDNCKQRTGRVGFNVAMEITPTQNANGQNCRKLACPEDNPASCKDGYHFPDDIKTHDCKKGTPFEVVFCPNGPGTSDNNTPAPPQETPAPAPAPAPVATTTETPSPSLSFEELTKNGEAGAAEKAGDSNAKVKPSPPVKEPSTGASSEIKGVYAYEGKFAGNVPGKYDRVTQLAGCVKQPVEINNPVGPMSEEVSMIFRGPMEIYDIAVYMPPTNGSSDTDTTSSRWTRVSKYSQQTGISENLVFLNNKNIDFSGAGGHGPQGFASADGLTQGDSATSFKGLLAEAKNPADIYGGMGVTSGAEVNIMMDKKCSADGDKCLGFHGDNDYHGWGGGQKIFITKVKMPQGTTPNQPAIWMLNAQVMHSNQYQCNCRGKGAAGGCGELDIAEVIETNPARDRVSTHYYFYDGTLNAPNGDNWAPRRVDTATVYVTIFDDSGDGLIKILEMSEFDFDQQSIGEELYAQWLQAKA